MAQRNSKVATVLYWTACFLAPIALLVVVCLWNGVYPFGAESFLNEDNKYQFVDFFTWFKHALAGQTSLFYVPYNGLGCGSWGMVGYYLSSPFNVLLPFFAERDLTLFFWVTTALKLGCIQVSMVWYLRKRFNIQRLMAFALAFCFTWSMWTATQMRTPIWLDALIVLPLMAYALFHLVRTGKWLPFALLTAVAVITCWYTAYMLLLFMCLLLVVEFVALSADGGVLDGRLVLKRIALFTVAALAGLLISAFTFAPTVFSMMDGKPGVPIYTLRMTGMKEVFAGLFLANWKINAVPQLFAGALPAVLSLAFVFMRGVPLRVKIVSVVVLGFLLVSTFFAPLLYVWSGFRIPSGFYCRITFFIVFFTVWMSAWAWNALGEGMGSAQLRGKHSARVPSVRALVAAGGVACAVVAAAFVAHVFVQPVYALGALASVVAVTALCVGMMREGFSESARRVFGVALCVVVFAELGYNAHVCWQQEYYGYTEEYHGAYVAESEAQLAELRAYDDGLYRVDKTYTRAGAASLNEGMTHGYLALSMYSSAQDFAAINMLSMLGYSLEGEMATCFTSPVLAMDSLLGVKYVSAETCPYGYEPTGLMRVEGSQTVDGAEFYLNPRALPFGYAVSPDALGFALDAAANPFERQNAFASALVGEKVTLYRPLQASMVDEGPSWRTFTADVPKGALGYVYSVNPEGNMLWLTVDGAAPVADYWRWRHCVTPLGNQLDSGSTHTVTIATDEVPNDGSWPINADASVIFYALDVAELDRLVDKLSQTPCEFQVFEGGNIQATCSMDADGYVMITVPDADGWTAQVNGADTRIQSTCEGGLMMIPVVAGDNAISLTYRTPWLFEGCCVSLVTLIALTIGFVVFRRSRSGRFQSRQDK